MTFCFLSVVDFSLGIRWQCFLCVMILWLRNVIAAFSEVAIKGGAGHRLSYPLPVSVFLPVFIFYLLEFSVDFNHLLHPAVRVVEYEIVGYEADGQ